MDNISIARLLDETAALLEIDAPIPSRIRSYRRAAEAVEQQTTQLVTSPTTPNSFSRSRHRKSMAAHIQALLSTGTIPCAKSYCRNTKPTMLELLRLPGMGPKTVALVWSACQVLRH